MSVWNAGEQVASGSCWSRCWPAEYLFTLQTVCRLMLKTQWGARDEPERYPPGPQRGASRSLKRHCVRGRCARAGDGRRIHQRSPTDPASVSFVLHVEARYQVCDAGTVHLNQVPTPVDCPPDMSQEHTGSLYATSCSRPVPSPLRVCRNYEASSRPSLCSTRAHRHWQNVEYASARGIDR